MAEGEERDDLRGKIERYSQGSYIEELHEAAAVLTGMVPVLGGPLGAYITGAANERKAKRLKELFLALADDLDGIKGKLSSDYLKTDDFADLFEETVRRVASERDEEKRRIYKNILVGVIGYQDVDAYDEQLRVLKTLDDLQPDHIAVLKAITVRPTEGQLLRLSGVSGFKMNTLEERLQDIPQRSIEDLVSDLNRMGLTDLRNLQLMMSASGAQDLSSSLTPYGERFLTFVKG